MYWVYCLHSREGLRYVGQTSDLQKRISEHNSGESKWTRRGNDWKLVYSEELETRSEAVRRERYFKTGVGREYLDSIVGARSSVVRAVDS